MNLIRKFKTAAKLIIDSDFRIIYISANGGYRSLSDEELLKKKFKAIFHKELDLENPRMFNEKLQWLKLYNRNPEYTRLVDKYEVKKYVAERIGVEYVIPTLGVWENFDEIDFDLLPDKFVLKCTHDSGGLIICTDKRRLDRKAAKKRIEACLKRNYYWISREWPYKDVKPRIIAETYMEDDATKELRDYKFFSFYGEIKALYIASERQNPNEDTKFDYFDENFHHLQVVTGHPMAKVAPQIPANVNKMVELVKKLAEGIPHVRVDLYEVNGKIYFGEMTFSHNGGFIPFEPEEWDYRFGEWLELPPMLK